MDKVHNIYYGVIVALFRGHALLAQTPGAFKVTLSATCCCGEQNTLYLYLIFCHLLNIPQHNHVLRKIRCICFLIMVKYILYYLNYKTFRQVMSSTSQHLPCKSLRTTAEFQVLTVL